MEDASRALWLAIGAILFIVAVTITIIMYSNMINTVNNTISINNIKTNITEEHGTIQEIQYDSAQIYYMLQGVYENFENGKNDIVYASGFSIDGTVINSDGSNIPSAPSGGGPYNVTYTYAYDSTTGIENMNNHKILSIDW